MARTRTRELETIKEESRRSNPSDPFKRRAAEEQEIKDFVHVIRKGVVCDTENRGFATPRNRSPLELVVDASQGFIPLWARGSSLRWRFEESSMKAFEDPDAAKAAIEQLLGEAILAWDYAAPIKFTKNNDAWDFEIVVRPADNCSVSGCVLASAFFPDAGQHKLTLFPMLFTQSRKEQVETITHEIGHIFGLRHFFAQVSETFPSEIFGEHNKFSIMNYGDASRLTDTDKSDLAKLYQMVWSGQLTQINGTPIRLVKPFHTLKEPAENMVAVAHVQHAA